MTSAVATEADRVVTGVVRAAGRPPTRSRTRSWRVLAALGPRPPSTRRCASSPTFEPELVLPHLTFAGGDRFLHDASAAIAPCFERFLGCRRHAARRGVDRARRPRALAARRPHRSRSPTHAACARTCAPSCSPPSLRNPHLRLPAEGVTTWPSPTKSSSVAPTLDDVDAILAVTNTDVDEVAARRPGRSSDAIFTWDYEQSRTPLHKLYEKAKTSQWNANDLPWDTDVDQEKVVDREPGRERATCARASR